MSEEPIPIDEVREAEDEKTAEPLKYFVSPSQAIRLRDAEADAHAAEAASRNARARYAQVIHDTLKKHGCDVSNNRNPWRIIVDDSNETVCLEEVLGDRPGGNGS